MWLGNRIVSSGDASFGMTSRVEKRRENFGWLETNQRDSERTTRAHRRCVEKGERVIGKHSASERRRRPIELLETSSNPRIRASRVEELASFLINHSVG